MLFLRLGARNKPSDFFPLTILIQTRYAMIRITLKVLEQILDYVENTGTLSREELEKTSKVALKREMHHVVSFIKERYG